MINCGLSSLPLYYTYICDVCNKFSKFRLYISTLLTCQFLYINYFLIAPPCIHLPSFITSMSTLPFYELKFSFLVCRANGVCCLRLLHKVPYYQCICFHFNFVLGFEFQLVIDLACICFYFSLILLHACYLFVLFKLHH